MRLTAPEAASLGPIGWSLSEKVASGLNMMFIPWVPQPEYSRRTTAEVLNLSNGRAIIRAAM